MRYGYHPVPGIWAWLIFIGLCSCTCTGPSVDISTPTSGGSRSGANENPLPVEQVLVKFRPGVSLQSIREIEKELGLKTLRLIPRSRIHVMKIKGGHPLEQILERLKKMEAVEYAEPNARRSVPD